MPAYTFDFLNRDGSIEAFDIGAFANDVEASDRARAALLVDLTAVAVEVWSEGGAVTAIRREGLPPMIAPIGRRRRGPKAP